MDIFTNYEAHCEVYTAITFWSPRLKTLLKINHLRGPFNWEINSKINLKISDWKNVITDEVKKCIFVNIVLHLRIL
jgi:hypothetical protein